MTNAARRRNRISKKYLSSVVQERCNCMRFEAAALCWTFISKKSCTSLLHCNQRIKTPHTLLNFFKYKQKLTTADNTIWSATCSTPAQSTPPLSCPKSQWMKWLMRYDSLCGSLVISSTVAVELDSLGIKYVHTTLHSQIRNAFSYQAQKKTRYSKGSSANISTSKQ